jgi:PKHD-type hydroxylase
MSFRIFTLLSPEGVSRCRQLLDNVIFEDGGISAPGAPKSLKNNLQYGRPTAANPTPIAPDSAAHLVDQAMRAHSGFLNYTLAKHWVQPSFSRYDTGMHYGDHVDASIMPSGPVMVRTDFAMTLFLSSPEDYRGGALILRSEFGEEEIKLEAGQAVVYSCRWIHRVEPITQGSRLVCLSWIQSHVADEGLRSVANDLHQLLTSVKPEEANSERHRLLSKAYHNLIRSTAQGL